MLALKQEPEQAGFWSWFEDNQAKFEKIAKDMDDMKMDDIASAIEELFLAIQDVDERLFAELSLDESGQYQMVITADGDMDAMLAARTLVTMAPELKGWSFAALKERDEPAEVIELTGAGEIDTREAVFVLEVHKGKAEIAVGMPEWQEDRRDDFNLVAEHMVEKALGEADFAGGVSGVMALAISDLQNECDPWPMKALASEFDKQLSA